MRRLQTWYYLFVAALCALLAMVQPAEADASSVSSPVIVDALVTQVSQAVVEMWPPRGLADSAHAP